MYEVFGNALKISDNFVVTLLGKFDISIGTKLKDNNERFFEVLSIPMTRYTDSESRHKYMDLYLKPIGNAETVGNMLYAV